MNNNNIDYDKNYEDHLKNQFKEFQSELDSYKQSTENFMKSSNFLFNTIFLDYEIKKPQPLLDDIQLVSLELLKFVENVCKKHDILWWIDFGNLLGAVRHGGYVPWDDDIDIGMMREDYLKFDKIITKEIETQGLDEYVYARYRAFKPVHKFIQVYVRHEVDMVNSKFTLGNVDVFPYEYIKKFDEKTIFDEYREAKNKYIKNKKIGFNSYYAFDKYYDDLNLSWEPTDYVIPGWESPCTPDDIYRLVIFERDKIFPLNEIEFAGYTFPCPKDPNYYLNKIYPGFMKIPINLRRHDRIGLFNYNTNNDEAFTNCINLLRDVNKNFR